MSYWRLPISYESVPCGLQAVGHRLLSFSMLRRSRVADS